MRRVGILGGTFDPVHNGHLLLGEQAYREYGLDEIWFMPSHVPPHKKRSSYHRRSGAHPDVGACHGIRSVFFGLRF